jgi:hypothetical protein
MSIGNVPGGMPALGLTFLGIRLLCHDRYARCALK